VTVGLAGQTAAALKAQGFNVIQYGNTDDNRSDYAQTQILVYTGRTATAQALAEALQVPSSAVQTASNPSGNYEIKVILGADYRLVEMPTTIPLNAAPVITPSSAITR
jgi:hypothetical protein